LFFEKRNSKPHPDPYKKKKGPSIFSIFHCHVFGATYWEDCLEGPDGAPTAVLLAEAVLNSRAKG
jgi:hypothetical protein